MEQDRGAKARELELDAEHAVPASVDEDRESAKAVTVDKETFSAETRAKDEAAERTSKPMNFKEF